MVDFEKFKDLGIISLVQRKKPEEFSWKWFTPCCPVCKTEDPVIQLSMNKKYPKSSYACVRCNVKWKRY